MNPQKLKLRIRIWIVLFIIGLALSGITAFPIETELHLLASHAGTGILGNWITTIYNAVHATNQQYPWLSYGPDWLAFGHLVIATAFIGPLRDPVRNIWIIEFGMIACVMVLPLAFIAGPIRHIPFYWQLIDCSFGVFGIIPLWIVRKDIKRLEGMEKVGI